jgi:hypothetical protein
MSTEYPTLYKDNRTVTAKSDEEHARFLADGYVALVEFPKLLWKDGVEATAHSAQEQAELEKDGYKVPEPPEAVKKAAAKGKAEDEPPKRGR